MIKLLSIPILILSLILFPPAALAIISNNAVTGDATYPVKRGLENVIYSVASRNSTTKAWFAKARSDRRFQEINILITQGKKAKEILNELVEQTQIAANQIDKIPNPVEKEKFISQLSDSITKYDQGLSQISQLPVFSPAPSPSSSPLASPISSFQPQPSTLPIPTSTPTPIPSTPTPSPSRQNDIDKTRDQLDKIKEQLEKQKQKHGVKKEDKEKEDNDKRQKKEQDDKKDKQDKQDKQDKNDDGSSKKGKEND